MGIIVATLWEGCCEDMEWVLSIKGQATFMIAVTVISTTTRKASLVPGQEHQPRLHPTPAPHPSLRPTEGETGALPRWRGQGYVTMPASSQ